MNAPSLKNSLIDSDEQLKIAAIKIQRKWRNHKIKVKTKQKDKYSLEAFLFNQAKQFIQNMDVQLLPRAIAGKTSVYLPKELPIVLKQTGSQLAFARFEKGKKAFLLCQKNQFSNLIIPRESICGNFLIQSRLPIPMHTPNEAVVFYIENRDRLTQAILEFTNFLCKSDLEDIAYEDPYSVYPNVGRYDNVIPYIENGQGKIGLIDLENFKLDRLNKTYFESCRDAIILFPLHSDEIIQAVKKFDPKIEAHRQKLENIRENTLTLFKIIYNDHLSLLNKREITIENPAVRLEELDKEQFEQLKIKIKNEIIAINCGKPILSGFSYMNCLGNDPKHSLVHFNEEILPTFLQTVFTLFNDHLENKLRNRQEPINSTLQLLSLRSLHLESNEVIKMLRPFQVMNIPAFSVDFFSRGFILHHLFEFILQQLKNQHILTFQKIRGDLLFVCL